MYTFRERVKVCVEGQFWQKMVIYVSCDILGGIAPLYTLEVYSRLCAWSIFVFFGFGLFKASNTPLTLIQDFAGMTQLQKTLNCQMNHKLALEIFTAGINSKISSNNSVSKKSVK